MVANVSKTNAGDESEPRVQLGQVVATANAAERLTKRDIVLALRRHAGGDWGQVDEHDRQQNEIALREGYRLLSAYVSAAGETFWVITEADRAVTTVLMPEDY